MSIWGSSQLATMQENLKAQQASSQTNTANMVGGYNTSQNNLNGWDNSGIIRQMMQQMMSSGMYNPLGSPKLLQMLRQQGMADAGAGTRGAYLQGRMADSSDPSMSAYGGLMGYLSGQGNLSKNLMNAGMQSSQYNTDFMRQMAGMYSQNDLQKQAMAYQKQVNG
jgi:hypothetical protein